MPSMSSQSVLIVEDDADLRAMYRVALVLAGYQVRVAIDGLDALRQIDSNPPDLVVLDLGLPVLSGHVVREQIAASAITRHISILVVTGTPEKAAGLNVACVLTKPVSPDRLVEAVRSCLAEGAPGRGVW
jgi:chemosensory pili system protein ChpA (sensor histidine kinase/response regulator)